MIKTKEDVKLHYTCEGIGVYSGLYILADDNYQNKRKCEFIEQITTSDNFVEYIHSLGRYKNGGYSTFTSKDLEKYLNYKWKNRYFTWNSNDR